MIKKRIVIPVSLCLLLAVFLVGFYRECALGGGMAGWYRDCQCKGIERLDYDMTAADGPRRTVCIGLVTEHTCYRYQGGPVVPCDTVPPR